MFIDFFLKLRQAKIPVTPTEWLTLMEAFDRGHGDASLTAFYVLTRAICVKHERLYDAYDRCFAEFFQVERALDHGNITDAFQEWLQNAKLPPRLSESEKQRLKSWDRDRLLKELEERLRNQKERHDGGSHWVGTGGTSPFGHGGYNPAGIRIGGPGQQQRAVHVAEQRQFSNLRGDSVLDTRQLGLALRKLRVLSRIGSESELDLQATIDQTGRNAGDIDLVFRRSRKNTVKLLMLSDVGGSMTPFSELSERLFSAASQANHFKAFQHYYFHNCPYEQIYVDMELAKSIKTEELLARYGRDWTLIFVGDAAMSPYELLVPGGSVDFYHHNDRPGIEWLQVFQRHFYSHVWINPIPRGYWHAESNQLIRRLFPMYPLSVDGVAEAAEHLQKIHQMHG